MQLKKNNENSINKPKLMCSIEYSETELKKTSQNNNIYSSKQ